MVVPRSLPGQSKSPSVSEASDAPLRRTGFRFKRTDDGLASGRRGDQGRTAASHLSVTHSDGSFGPEIPPVRGRKRGQGQLRVRMTRKPVSEPDADPQEPRLP